MRNVYLLIAKVSLAGWIVEFARDDSPLVEVLGRAVVDLVVEVLLEDADAEVAPGVDGAAGQGPAVVQQRELVVRVRLAVWSVKDVRNIALLLPTSLA